jgi:adenylate kinase
MALFGPPGAGKGTQAAALGRRFHVPVVSTGELLRSRARSDDDTGRTLGDLLARGELVDDDVVHDLLDEAMRAPATERGYVLDGYPRTQAQAFDPRTPPVDVVVHLALPDEVTRARIATRRDAAHRRDDADARAIDNRVSHYHSMTEPLLDLYRARGQLVTVDATKSVDEVTDAILRALADRGVSPSR